MSLRRRLGLIALVVLPPVLVLLLIGGLLFERQGGLAPYRVPRDSARLAVADAATLARGAYLARIGNCASCHTVRGGIAYAGGRGFATGYGTVYSSNLTPDPQHGIGAWSADEFAHAMRHGVSRRGPLYPVFPYANFALLEDADLDALYAFLRNLPPSSSVPPENVLDFPASSRNALVLWRMLYYRPAEPVAAGDRGRYLVDGLGHCAMCHGSRGAGGSLLPQGYLAGGRLPGSGWYAPALDRHQLARYSIDQLSAYLRGGATDQGAAYGPMAEVVYTSLHALNDGDAQAIAGYLKGIAAHPAKSAAAFVADTPAHDAVDGATVYKRACADCHGADGEGVAGKFPPLRAAVAVTAPDPLNAVRLVLYGGLPPVTPGNPQPYSMPPFVQQLSAAEIAAVLNHIRSRWGAPSSLLAAPDVEAMLGVPLD